MEYKVMAKGRHEKRYQCYGHHTDATRAERNAMSLVRSAWTKGVKVICDDGFAKEELIYKSEA